VVSVNVLQPKATRNKLVLSLLDAILGCPNKGVLEELAIGFRYDSEEGIRK
jgi:hypothetical protein